MLLIFSDNITERLRYVCHFILKEQLGLDYSISTDLIHCSHSEHYVINYSHKNIEGEVFKIKPHALLFENNIKPQQIECALSNNQTSFFNIKESDIEFDVFAAVFYLISRYEEYLPHSKDQYGRYAHENSIAFKNNFLHIPIVNIWIAIFSEKIKHRFQKIICYKPTFKTLITYDIDIAWSYLNKGLWRSIGGMLKKPSLERIKVLLKLKRDPFDCYDFLDELHQSNNTEVIYFFLMADKKGAFDKNISPQKSAFQKLIKNHAKFYQIGLHPSWKSFMREEYLNAEKSSLEKIIKSKIINSRQHYIKFDLPNTYQHLIDSGIQNDFSMGYGSINGFRASVASSFFWYDLPKENITNLRIFPFCFMDANCHYEQNLTILESKKELFYYRDACKEINGLFIPIFHNNFMGSDPAFVGWRNIYRSLLA